MLIIKKVLSLQPTLTKSSHGDPLYEGVLTTLFYLLYNNFSLFIHFLREFHCVFDVVALDDLLGYVAYHLRNV